MLIDDLDDGDGLESMHLDTVRHTVGGILGTVLGPQVRLFAGLLMLVVFVIWLRADYPNLPAVIAYKVHHLVDPSYEHVAYTTTDAVNNKPDAPLTADDVTVKAANDAAGRLTHMSDQTRQNVVNTENWLFWSLGNWQGGLAGALLLFSSLFRSRLKMGLFMLGSTASILIVGRHLMIPTHGIVRPENAGMVLGTLLAFSGFLFARKS